MAVLVSFPGSEYEMPLRESDLDPGEHQPAEFEPATPELGQARASVRQQPGASSKTDICETQDFAMWQFGPPWQSLELGHLRLTVAC